jgi:hypothetical protein
MLGFLPYYVWRPWFPHLAPLEEGKSLLINFHVKIKALLLLYTSKEGKLSDHQ